MESIFARKSNKKARFKEFTLKSDYFLGLLLQFLERKIVM